MKKIFITFIVVIMMMPFFVNAETLDINSKEVTDILKKYNIEECNFLDSRWNLLESITQKSTIENPAVYKYDINNLPNYLASQLATDFVKNDDITKNVVGPDELSDWESISEDTYNKAYKEAFGPDVIVKKYEEEKTSLNKSICGVYTYFGTLNKFLTTYRCGGTGVSYDSFLIKAEQNSENNIDYINLYTKSYYLKEGKVLGNFNDSDIVNLKDLSKDNIKHNYADYITTYKFTFKKASDDNYYFYSIENMKDAKDYVAPTPTNKGKKISNPKTADMNVLVSILSLFIVGGILIFSFKNIRKNN